MKKIIFLILGLGFLAFCRDAFAYSEEEEVCYGQCATYKFVWQGDYCYDTFQQECAIGGGNTIKETIKFLKGIYSTVKSGKGVENVFKAWFVCKPLIENCIVPQLRECRDTCSQEPLHYAPDISVGNPYGNFVYHGVVYNDNDKTLTFKVINNGMGYAWDIGANASWGHTRDRNGQVSRGGVLFDETIPELLYAGARHGPPKTVGDYIGDFLIEETNFSNYLQFLKSDADNYEVPSIWYKTIPFTPPEGELTKVTFNVDSNQMIKERSELNNSFVLVIDKLPTPPSFQIDNFSQILENNTLNNFLIDFEVKNTGEENGQMTVKIFEDKHNETNSQTAIFESSQTVLGLNKFNFNTFIAPDVSNKDDYCGKTKEYELVVFDDGSKVDTHQFSLPLYSGSVRGRVEDLFDKGVDGATVRASSGQITTTGKTGAYYLPGINQLGKVTITVTHPDFSKVETKEVEFKMGNTNRPCDEGNLTLNQVNFVLQDQEVMFTISIKDKSGNPVTAQVLASNQDWRFDEEVSGEGPLPGMQPGKYVFTLSAPGYKTVSQDINAVPNQQNLEFVMEVLNGRLTDGGLTIFDQPQLLWQMDRGTEIFAQMTATKDGKEVMLYTTQNKAMTGKLYFLDAMTGNQIKVVAGTVATGGQSQACLDTSYDGNTTSLYVHNRAFGTSKDSRNVLKLFDNQGRAIGTTEFESGSANECDVSPDGFYVYPNKLLNKGLYTYTRFDIQGQKNSKQAMTYPGLLHFTTSNNVVVGCPTGGGQCLQTLNDTVISNLGKVDGSVRNIDSSQDGSSMVIGTISKAYLFKNGSKAWEKETITKGHPLTISVSPGGKMVIYSTYVEGQNYRTVKIFSDNNLDKTPVTLPSNREEDVLVVHANDKGLFFATQDEKIIKYYQVGSYSNEYNPVTPVPSQTGQLTTNNISYYDDGVWRDLGQVNLYQLLPGRMYMANTTVNLQVESLGKLTILDGTIFGTDNYINPVLLKGQITANFASPYKIYAIKFDRYDLNLFDQKLAQFTAGELPQAEYFRVQNVHTKFVVKNYENKFEVIAVEGEVEVLGKEVDETVESGRQIRIDGENKIDKMVYMGGKIYAILTGVLIVVGSIILFIYRDTKIGKKIITILKKVGKLLLKYGKILVILVGKYFIIFIKWLVKIIKMVLQKLIQLIKKIVKNKQ